jgi:hypothetical protein
VSRGADGAGASRGVPVVAGRGGIAASNIGYVPQPLLDRMKRHEIDTGVCDGVTPAEAQRVKDLFR